MPDTPFGLPLKILAVATPGDPSTAAYRGAHELGRALDARNLEYVVAHTAEDAVAAMQQDPLIGCLVVDWDLVGEARDGQGPASRVLTSFRSRNGDAPVFLVGERSLASDVPLDMLEAADDDAGGDAELDGEAFDRRDDRTRPLEEVRKGLSSDHQRSAVGRGG